MQREFKESRESERKIQNKNEDHRPGSSKAQHEMAIRWAADSAKQERMQHDKNHLEKVITVNTYKRMQKELQGTIERGSWSDNTYNDLAILIARNTASPLEIKICMENNPHLFLQKGQAIDIFNKACYYYEVEQGKKPDNGWKNDIMRYICDNYMLNREIDKQNNLLSMLGDKVDLRVPSTPRSSFFTKAINAYRGRFNNNTADNNPDLAPTWRALAEDLTGLRDSYGKLKNAKNDQERSQIRSNQRELLTRIKTGFEKGSGFEEQSNPRSIHIENVTSFFKQIDKDYNKNHPPEQS